MEARLRLARYLSESGLSQETAAVRLGCHQTYVSRLLRGEQGPRLRVAHAIRDLTSDWAEGPIEPEEWLGSSSADPAAIARSTSSSTSGGQDAPPSCSPAAVEGTSDVA